MKEIKWRDRVYKLTFFIIVIKTDNQCTFQMSDTVMDLLKTGHPVI